MNASWKREGQRLIVSQNHGWLWLLRVGLGGPLFYYGVKMAWWAVSEPVHRYFEGGWSAVIGWLPSTFFTVIFAALLLPIGWWILAFRRLVIVDAEKKEVLVIKDWRVGKKTTAHQLGKFRKVAVVRDYVLNAQESQSATNSVGHYVRLEPRDYALNPLQIAMFGKGEREQPEALGRAVGELIGLRVIVNLDEIAKQRTTSDDE